MPFTRRLINANIYHNMYTKTKSQSVYKETILLTGCAGFIGARTSELLLEQGYTVVGIDNINDYYDVKLKEQRLEKLKAKENFTFRKIDIEDAPALNTLFADNKFSAIINLAARAGVRYSMENPHII